MACVAIITHMLLNRLETMRVARLRKINSDDELMAVGFSDGAVSVEGLSTGSAIITTEMLSDLKPVRIPNYSIIAPELAVTIVP